MSDKILQEDGFGLLLEDGSGYLVKEDAVATGLDIDFTTGTLDPRITSARSSTATYINASGLVATAASGAPRFDYTLGSSLLLVEGQATNLFLNSQDFAAGSWINGGGITLGGLVTAPDGTTTGRTFNVGSTSASSFHQYFPSGLPSAVLSVWAKKSASGGANKLRMTTNNSLAWGTGVSQVFTLTSAWQRFTLSGIPGGSGNIGICDVRVPADGSVDPNVADLVGNVDIWGAQLEAGIVATSYIPTTSVAVTRAADTAVMAGTNFSSWYNAAEGTFLIDCTPTLAAVDQGWFAPSDGSDANRMPIAGQSAGTVGFAVVTSSIVQMNSPSANLYTVLTPNKAGFAYKANDSGGCLNGGTVVFDTSVVIPAVSQLDFGRGSPTANPATQLWLKRFQYFNTRKTDAELQALTASSIDGTGALVAQAAVAASTTGVSGSAITDTTLNASPAVVASTTGISGSVITDTTLNASSALLSSTTGVSGSLITDTTLNASAAVLSSTTGLIRAIGNASALTAQAVTVIGLGTGAGAAVIGAGALSTRPATLVSTGLTRTIGSGALVDGSATLGALAISGSTGIGELDATTADVEGLGYVEQGGVSIMVGGEWQRTTPYVRVGGTWKPATAWANVNGEWKRVA